MNLTGELLIHNSTAHEDGGLVASANFTQTITNRDFVKNSLKLYYDNDALSIYAQSWQTVSGDGKKEIPFLLRDYGTTDSFLSGGDKPWRGWTTGEVKMSMYAVGVSSTANVMLMKIDGEDLSQAYVPDNVPPVLTLQGVQDEKDLPKAEVGTPYRLFIPIWRDLYSSVVKEDVSVFFGNSKITIVDGKFTPNQTGKYTVRYSAYDSYGNKAEKSIEIEAIAVANKPTVTLIDSFPEYAVVGQRIYIPKFVGEGGVGWISTSAEVTCGGESVRIEYGSFLCTMEGTYTVKLIATDYIGNEGTLSLRIRNVAVSSKPVFDERSIQLPDSFIQGDIYTFPSYEAILYTAANKSEKIAGRIEVTDASGTHIIENGKYMPMASDTVSKAKTNLFLRKGVQKLL